MVQLKYGGMQAGPPDPIELTEEEKAVGAEAIRSSRWFDWDDEASITEAEEQLEEAITAINNLRAETPDGDPGPSD